MDQRKNPSPGWKTLCASPPLRTVSRAPVAWRPRNSSPCACAAKLTSTLDKSEKCSREEECATAPRRIIGVLVHH